MPGAVLFIAVGAAAAAVGARVVTRGVAAAAGRHGVPPAALGAALLGLSLEAVVTVLVAAVQADGAIVVGVSLGTPVLLMAVGLGAGLLLAPGPVPAPAPAALLAPAATMLATALASADGALTRFDGAALLAVFAASVGVLVREARAAEAFGRRRSGQSRRPFAGLTALAAEIRAAQGLVLLVFGALVLVHGGERIVAEVALAPGFVAAAVLGGTVGIGRGLLDVLPGMARDPATVVVDPLASLAVVGTGALGLAALIRPLIVDSAALSALLAAGAMYAAVAVPMLARGRAGRLAGAVVLALYGLWLALGSRI